MYTPTVYFGDEVRENWEKYNDYAFDGNPSRAKRYLETFESSLIKNSVSNGSDPEDVLGKIKTLKAILDERVSEEGRKQKLIRHTNELVELMNEDFVKGNVLSILEGLLKKFSNLFIEFIGEDSYGRPKKIHNLLDIMEKMRSLSKQIEDEELLKAYNRFCGTLGEMEGALSDAIMKSNKKSNDAVATYKKMRRQANKIMNYRPKGPKIEFVDEGKGGDEGEEESEVVGQVDGENITKEDLKDISEGRL